MKLSLKVIYACQVLAQLGRTYGQPTLPHIESLAAAEQIPQNYLVQILNELRTGGLIVSKRGKQGGYALAREPRAITLVDIIEAVEGELLELPPASEGGASQRAVSHIWQAIVASYREQCAGYTVAELMLAETETMYYI